MNYYFSVGFALSFLGSLVIAFSAFEVPTRFMPWVGGSPRKNLSLNRPLFLFGVFLMAIGFLAQPLCNIRPYSTDLLKPYTATNKDWLEVQLAIMDAKYYNLFESDGVFVQFGYNIFKPAKDTKDKIVALVLVPKNVEVSNKRMTAIVSNLSECIDVLKGKYSWLKSISSEVVVLTDYEVIR
jgi:hypothetical protein